MKSPMVDGPFASAAQNSASVGDKDVLAAIRAADHSEIFQRDILTVVQLLNKHVGPKNHLLDALVATVKVEAEEGISQQTKDAREYHNMEIRRLVTQHAEPGFDFDNFGYQIFLATCKETRVAHIMWAQETVQERWAEEASEREEAQRQALIMEQQAIPADRRALRI